MYEKITLSAKALFDFDKSDLKPEGRAALDEVSDKIKAKGASVVDIDIIGHTDSIGTEEYNQGLSERRATSVRDFLAQQGIGGQRMVAVGYGLTRPVADNSSREGRARNRRVEIVIAEGVISEN